MADREQLIALLARCEAASGPDRELDTDILRAIHAGPQDWRNGVAYFTASIDAALALSIKMVGTRKALAFLGTIASELPNHINSSEMSGGLQCFMLCKALMVNVLRALIAQDPEHT